MANISCPVFVPCPDSPILNLSAEDPDVFYWPGYFYPQPCRQILCPPTFYQKDCFGVVYSATSQADADALAQQASVNCQDRGVSCTNEPQTATVTCANGTVVSFTCPAGTFNVSIMGTYAACLAAANAQALAFAQQQVSLLAQTTCVSNQTHCSFTTGATLPDGVVATAYSKQLVASITGFPVGYFVISGSLPPGLSLNSSGTISGTPTTLGTYQFSVRAETSLTSCNKQFSITISDCPLPKTLTLDPAFLAAINSYPPASTLTGIFTLVNCDRHEYSMPDPAGNNNGYIYFNPVTRLYTCLINFAWNPSFGIHGGFMNDAVLTYTPPTGTDPRGSYLLGISTGVGGYSSGDLITLS